MIAVRRYLLVLCVLALGGCTTLPPFTLNKVTVWKSPVLALWFHTPEECAATLGIQLVPAATADEADVALTWGVPINTHKNYQVGSANLSIISNDAGLLGTERAQLVSWFVNGTGPSLVLYPLQDDVMQVFTQRYLSGSPVSRSAELALDHQQMIVAVSQDGQHLGVLPSVLIPPHLKELDRVDDIPVLASTIQEPSGPAKDLIACMQAK